jgi:hypothetical protein
MSETEPKTHSETEEPKVCNVKIKQDPVEGWKLVIDELGPACEESLKRIVRDLGPYSRKYLAKRIETSNPEVKKILEGRG